MDRMRGGTWFVVTSAWAVVVLGSGCGGGTTNRCTSGELTAEECRRICSDYDPGERPDWCGEFLADGSAGDASVDGGMDGGSEDGGSDGSMGDGGCTERLFYADCDGDGFAAAGAETAMGCEAPGDAPGGCGAGSAGGWTDRDPAGDGAADCDDASGSVNPEATESCNGVDDDCDGETDEGVLSTFYADGDGDGYGDETTTMQGCEAPSGYVARGGDCDDTSGSVNPGATESCNGVDDNCDGGTDEGGDALCTDAAEPECLPSGMCACRPEVSRVSSPLGGTLTLLVPGRQYILCGGCLDGVDQVELGGTTVSGTFVGSACGGMGGVRFTVPSDPGVAHQLRAVDSAGMRRSEPFSVEVATLRLNEVDVRTGSGANRNRAQFVEVCVVDGAGRGVGNVALDGYAVRAYDDVGAAAGNWSLAGKRTADGGCMLLGNPNARPASWLDASWVTIPVPVGTPALPSPGAVTVEMGPAAGTASEAASGGRVLDAVVYKTDGTSTTLVPMSLQDLLNGGAARVAVIDDQADSAFSRCGTALRDGRAWQGNRPLTKGALANMCM